MDTRSARQGLINALKGPVMGLYAAPVFVPAVLSVLEFGPVAQMGTAVVAYLLAVWAHFWWAGRLNRMATEATAPELDTVDLASVATLIATGNASQGAGQAVGTLISQMPNLNEVHLILGHCDVAAQAKLIDVLEGYSRSRGRTVAVGRRPLTISPHELTDVDQAALRHYFEGFVGRSGTWVDITGGTAAMSVAVNRAASALGLRICYTATVRTVTPPVFRGVVDISG